ncbi:hypothetical protein [Goodfellowiella coeruleoviolacea]|uniref:Uncharacterized protein n=1 Tax=Goodfellowiella coeruleoviolacea TaxID=334858 RepID=A0AAE3GD49_9PSEU|nr:hypothetical protein [Goodfellowiella coeruleoviolacea]MCP2163963.1 hypothetical protein [Goodfellowiella coeruleoviolacea]
MTEVVYERGFSETTGTFLAIGVLVCVVLAVSSVTLYVRVRRRG